MVEWLGFHGNYRRCVGSSHPSHRGRKSTLHKARHSQKYINILIHIYIIQSQTYENLHINKYLNTHNIN